MSSRTILVGFFCALSACTKERPPSQSAGQSNAEPKSASLASRPGDGGSLVADGTSDALPVSAPGCDASLWAHVYNPDRLQKLNPCIAVTGKVAVSIPDDDGDQHFLLILDAGQENLLTKRNLKKKSGFLVAEIVCANPVKLKKVKSACAGYTNRIPLPGVGEHVRVTGTHVIDTHNGWAEIHPVSRVEKL